MTNLQISLEGNVDCPKWGGGSCVDGKTCLYNGRAEEAKGRHILARYTAARMIAEQYLAQLERQPQPAWRRNI